MIEVDESLIDGVTATFYDLLRGRVPDPLAIPAGLPDNEIRQLLTYINRFLAEYAPLARAMAALAGGELELTPPPGRLAVALDYKALQSNLRHLTWKTQRIAAGHLEERVDFLGELSEAYNSMARQLRESFDAIEQRNAELKAANAAIRREQEKSDRLLLNVLPAQVAQELKEHGASAPQSFDEVTVLFSDIVGFTPLSAAMSPRDLIAELNTLFTRFDEIMAAHGCERIKTIGDAYLAVCGLPTPDPRHAQRMVAAARELLAFVRTRQGWQIRVGIHSGRLVGGIVGTTKYIYDVFGDTVNTASRMETCSEPMRINLSAATWRLVAGEFPCLPRGPVEVKGKGPMEMYFLDTEGGAGVV